MVFIFLVEVKQIFTLLLLMSEYQAVSLYPSQLHKYLLDMVMALITTLQEYHTFCSWEPKALLCQMQAARWPYLVWHY